MKDKKLLDIFNILIKPERVYLFKAQPVRTVNAILKAGASLGHDLTRDEATCLFNILNTYDRTIKSIDSDHEYFTKYELPLINFYH